MEFLLVGIVALLASILTFFSGFGLGTILTPVFILFFPVDLAIAMTAIVHFLNNLLKMALVYNSINWKVTLRFGLPAILGAFLGARMLIRMGSSEVLYTYEIGNITAEVEGIKLIVAVLMMVFAILELLPFFKKLQFEQDKLVFGGLLSGFFGGLSGHQGALRSLFLIKCGLNKASFIATGVAIASFIDITRMVVYFNQFRILDVSQHLSLLLVAIIAAFTGAVLGKFLLTKITLHAVQLTVSILIILLSLLLAFGII